MPRPSFIAIAALIVQTTLASRPGDESCVVTPSNDCSLSKLKPSAVDGSTLVYPGGSTRCAFDNWSSPNSTYKTNSTYFFQDATSCSFGFICSSGFETFYADPRSHSEGFMNRTDPANVFKDWNIINLPYCTGDLHMGNQVLDGTDPAAVVALNKPACPNQNQSVHMNGLVNADSAFAWALKNFPDIDQLVLSGSSAGAIAIQFHAKRIAEKWQVQQRKIKYSVLVDSYIGVFPDETPLGSLINFIGACAGPWGLPSDVVEACKTSKATTTELVKPTIRATSYADWLFADSTADKTQRLYYELLRQGILAYPFKTMIAPEKFHDMQTQVFESYETIAPKLFRFVEVSDRHVFFKTNDWVDILGEDNKTTLGSVVRASVEENVVPQPTSLRPSC